MRHNHIAPKTTIWILSPIVLVLILSIGTCQPSFAQSKAQASAIRQLQSKKAIRTFTDSVASNALIKGPGAGLSIGIVQGNDTLVWRGWGKANVELNVPATPATVYRIGSISKQYTAAIIMRLVEEGRLHLDDPLAKYVPGYNTHGKTVTIRELLTHTSGVPDYPNNPAFIKYQTLDLTPSHFLAYSIRDSLDFPPGTNWSYSNTGFCLLGLVIEKITGQPFNRYVRDSLLVPLGLTHSYYGWMQPIIPNRAEGYAVSDSVSGIGKLNQPILVNAPPISMATPFSAGSLCSTIGDLIRWVQLLHTGKVVSLASYKLMSTPAILPDGRNTHYGFGLMTGDPDGHPVIGHYGGINGFLSILTYYPDDSLTIVVLSNSTSVDPDPIERHISQYILEGTVQNIKPLPLPSHLDTRLTGKYLPLDGSITRIYMQGDSLISRAGKDKPTRLLYIGKSKNNEVVFAPADSPGLRVYFDLPENSGKPAYRFRFRGHSQFNMIDNYKRTNLTTGPDLITGH